VFRANQRLRLSFTLPDGTIIQETAVALHVDMDESVGVLAPHSEWRSIDKADEFKDQVETVRLIYPVGLAAEELDVVIKRWPTRPRAHLAVRGFNEVTEVRRRRFLRVDVQRPIVFGYASGTKFERLSGSTVNVSAGGVMAVFANSVPKDAFIAVIVDLGPRTITAVGVPIDIRMAEPDLPPVLAAMNALKLGEKDQAWQARLEFNQISTAEQDALATWALRQEQQNRSEFMAEQDARDRLAAVADAPRKSMIKVREEQEQDRRRRR
jgi:hypothetical protein